MIVLDASVVVELLSGSVTGSAVFARLIRDDDALHAPELMDVEVLQVLRRAVSRGLISERRAEQSLSLLAELPVTRHSHSAFRRRCWQLRANLTAYDAMYVALAEGLSARLLTRDARIARAPEVRALVEVV
jgi:predicted nucleic acid-binding protein